MTDQIAPSLATELEQAAKRLRDLAAYNCMAPCADSDLLTRAAALARAAEAITDRAPTDCDSQGEGYECHFCGNYIHNSLVINTTEKREKP